MTRHEVSRLRRARELLGEHAYLAVNGILVELIASAEREHATEDAWHDLAESDASAVSQEAA